MTLIAEQPRMITPDELLRMPDSSTMELVDGRIVEKNVSLESSEIEGLFFFRIQTFLVGHAGYAKVFPASCGYQCFRDDPDKVRRPDTTVVKLERIRALPDPNPGFMPIVPDLAIEVISPKDLAYKVEEKVQEYIGAGFPLVWVAHPKARTITVHRPGVTPLIFAASEEITADGLLPGFRCRVADFFPPPLPRVVT